LLSASRSPGPAPDFTPAKGVNFIYAPLLLRGENIVNKALGVFSNVSWEFLDGLTASGGIRLSRERKKADLSPRQCTRLFRMNG